MINEIAWMGTANSASDEWIELYNDGSEGVSLDGWMLGTEDGATNISLTGSLAGGGYYLIERTDDTTVPNVTADMITPFGSGLSNSGEVLLVKNGNGTVIDRVDASSGWPAGDNTTKETMQRSVPSAGGWVTALATPKAANASIGSNTTTESGTESDSNDQTTPSSGGSSAGGGGDSPYVSPEKLPRIKTDAGKDTHAAVGEEVQFHAEAWGFNDAPLENARFLWNFGDGATREGQHVGHAYMFPGTYVVRVTTSSGKYSAFDDLRVDVGENSITVSELFPGDAGWIEFQNKGSNPIHVGGWIVESSAGKFVIPSGSSIAPQSFVVLARSITNLSLNSNGDHVYLYYPNGTYADGIAYIFQVPQGKSISNNFGVGVFTDPTPGGPNAIHIKSTPQIPSQPANPSIGSANSLPKKAPPIVDVAPQQKEIISSTSASEENREANFQSATLADAPLRSNANHEVLWFGGSLIAGGLAAVLLVFFRRRKHITNDTML